MTTEPAELPVPPPEFMELAVAYVEKSQIDAMEALYAPEEIVDYCLGACEYLPEDWYDAFSLLKELAIGFSSKEHPAVYAPIVANSRLSEKARAWLRAEPRKRRTAVIFVLGKLTDEQYLPLLEEAFDHWKDRDPFMMEGLIFELGWLGDEAVNEKVAYLATHDDFVFRLSVIEGLQYGAESGDEDDIRLLDGLKSDPVSAVVAATREDPYFFTLAYAACRRELYGDDEDAELSLEDFRRWVEARPSR